ncbi:hypothetical protein HDU99_001909 [Rhizoclosmatium hyalinum]|nr:hypothetical protein HDU99_001909 [Rhizoclosmatium hyalinum]
MEHVGEELVGPASLVRWCPQRDLVLISGSDGASAARLDALRRVWSVPAGAAFAAAAWQPGGRLLAVVRKLPAPTSLQLLDAESGKVTALAAMRPPSLNAKNQPNAYITRIEWAQFQPNASSITNKQTRLLLQALPPTKPAQNNSVIGQGIPSTSSTSDPFDRFVRCGTSFADPSDILVWMRDDATVEFSLWGLFYLGRFACPISKSNASASFKAKVLDCSFSHSLSQFTVAFQIDEEGASISSCQIYTLNTDILSISHVELCSIAFASLKLSYLVTNELGGYMTALVKEFDSFYEASQRQVANLAETFIKQHETMTPLDSLHLLLATGHAIPPLESYLCGHSLGDRGLRKWKNSFQTGYVAIESLINGSIIPSLERVMLHLSDLLGFSKMSGKYSSLGLSPAVIEACIDTVLEFVDALQRVRGVLKQEVSEFSEFFGWLTFAIESISTLGNGGGADTVPTPSFQVEKVFAALEKLYTCDPGVELFFGKNGTSRVSATSISASLKQCLKEIFDRVWMTVESHFTVEWESKSSVSQAGANSEKKEWTGRCCLSTLEDESLMIAVVSDDPVSQHLTLYKLSQIEECQEGMVPTVTQASLSIHENNTIALPVDTWHLTCMVFLNSDLIVLLHDKETGKSVVFQIDTADVQYKPIYEFTDCERQISNVKCTLEMDVGKVPKEVHANSSRNIVSVLCTDQRLTVYSCE